jgi:hypothetical protein
MTPEHLILTSPKLQLKFDAIPEHHLRAVESVAHNLKELRGNKIAC